MANIRIKLNSIRPISDTFTYSDVKLDSEAVNDKYFDKQSIRQSVHNILTWKRGERILYPEFGNVIYDYIFENMNSDMISKMKSDINKMLQSEPRITVTEISISASIDANQIDISVKYDIPSLDDSDSMSISIFR